MLSSRQSFLPKFAAITVCVTSQRVFVVVVVYFFMTQSGNFWIHPRNELHNLQCSPYVIIGTRQACVWEDNIEISVKEIMCEQVDWIHLAQDRYQWRVGVNTVNTFRVP
jgi:hypothetical protein